MKKTCVHGMERNGKQKSAKAFKAKSLAVAATATATEAKARIHAAAQHEFHYARRRQVARSLGSGKNN